MDYNQTGLPLLSLETEPPDFDYDVFLQEEDVDYLAEDSSVSVSTGTLTIPIYRDADPPSLAVACQNISSSASNSNSNSNSPPKQRQERRGHTKSRRGCYNCKRRRIKCQETRPACGHCIKTGLPCEYPMLPLITHQPQNQVPLFSLQDMRFFQYFLLQGYPHHPLGNEQIWTHEIPCLSQTYEYLMHAILGLSASELMHGDPSLLTCAMTHRLKAIRAIKKTLAEADRANTFEEGNALMATCYALTFQSVLLDDGMVEYMTFVRGVVIVAMQMYMKGSKFLFHNFIGEDQMALLAPHMEKVPLIDRPWTDAAVSSIEALGPLCRGEMENKYHELLLGMANCLYVSAVTAYKAMSEHYGWWMMLPHDKFQQVVDMNNPINVLLGAHWIALKQIMAIITETEHRCSKKPPPAPPKRHGDMEVGIRRWLRYLNARVEPEYVVFNKWPIWVEAQLERNPAYFGASI